MAQTMIRLSASIRDQTINTLMKRKFLAQDLANKERYEKMLQQKRDLYQYAYEACFTKKQIEQLNAAPDGWFPMAYHCRIRIENVNNPDNYYDDNAVWGETGTENPRRVPYRNSNYSQQFAGIVKDNHPYVVALKAYKAAEEEAKAEDQKLREEKRAATNKLLAVMESVTTVKRLQEIWPEVSEFLPELVSGEGGQVPAEMIADLNREFGIK